MKIQINPSLLSANVGKLESELQLVSNGNWAHNDVMDNHFVPNLTWGLPVTQACVKANILPVDTHLMIDNPDRWAPEYAKIGSKGVTFHAEAALAPITLARTLRKMGVKTGVAFRPATPVEPFLDLLNEFDMVLIMTVEPGFGGQTFIEPMLEKVRKVRKAADAVDLKLDIQVDGGISKDTIQSVAAAGANVFVAGSAVFNAENPAKEIDVLRQLAQNAQHGK